TGYADRAEVWVNSGALLARMNFALALASGRYPHVTVDLAPLVAGSDPLSPPERRGPGPPGAAPRPGDAACRSADHAAVGGRPRAGKHGRRQAGGAGHRLPRGSPAGSRPLRDLLTPRPFSHH